MYPCLISCSPPPPAPSPGRMSHEGVRLPHPRLAVQHVRRRRGYARAAGACAARERSCIPEPIRLAYDHRGPDRDGEGKVPEPSAARVCCIVELNKHVCCAVPNDQLFGLRTSSRSFVIRKAEAGRGLCRVRLYKTSQESCTPSVWVSSWVHAWRGASRLMHARHTRVRVPHSSLLPCTEPPELRVPRRADLGRGPTQKPPGVPPPCPCAVRRAPSPVGSGRRGLFVTGTSIVATSTCRPALRPATQAATLTVPKPKADTRACALSTTTRRSRGRAPTSRAPHTPCIKIMINILRALKRRWILIVAFQSLGATRCRFLSRT